MEQVNLATMREIADKHNVKSAEDIVDLEKSLKRLENDVMSVMKSLSEEQLRLKRISGMMAAY